MKLNRKGYLRIFTRHPSHKGLRNYFKLPQGVRMCLRLGSNTPTRGHAEINKVNSVENSSNKLLMKELFTVGEVKSPTYYKLDKSQAYYLDEQWTRCSFTTLSERMNYPVLAKRTYRSRGAGMQKIDNKTQFMTFIREYVRDNNRQDRNPYYIEEFKNYSREYRLHISENGCFYSCRKMLRSDATNRWMRNDSNSIWVTEKNLTKHDPDNVTINTITYEGENESFNKPSTWEDIVADCNNARKALEMDICCFDVKVNKQGNWTILESNSAPSFGSVTEIMYKEEIAKLINSKLNV